MKAQVVFNVLIGKLFLLWVDIDPIEAIGGISIIFYFWLMIYYKVVRKYHGGRWGSFLKSILKGFKNGLCRLFRK